MMAHNSFMRTASYLLSGMAVYALSQWLIISFLAHTAGAGVVGQFTLAMSLIAPAMVLTSLSTRTLLQTDVDNHAAPFKDYWHLRLLTNIFLLLIGIGLAWIYHTTPGMVGLIIAITCYKIGESSSDITFGLAQRHQQSHIMSRGLLLRGGSGIVAFVSCYWLTNSLLLSISALAISALLVFYLHDWRHTKPWHGALAPLDWSALRRITWISLPIGVATFISGFNIVLPRLVLEEYAGLEALGIFAALAYALTVGNLVINAMANTLLSTLTDHWNNRRFHLYFHIIAKQSVFLAGLCTIGTLTAWLAGKPLLHLLYGSTFAQYHPLFIAICGASSVIILANFWGYLLLSTRTFTAQLILNAATLGVVAIAAYMLIPPYGIWGATGTLLVFGATKILANIATLIHALKQPQTLS